MYPRGIEDLTPANEEPAFETLEKTAGRLARIIAAEKQDGKPYVFGIDGAPGLGKSTVARAITAELEKQGKRVCIIHVDDYLSPNVIRKQPGDLGKNYYENNVRHDKLEKEVLKPLIENGELKGTRMGYSFKTDSDSVVREDNVDGDTIVILEGAMLLRDRLKKYFDLSLHLRAGIDVAIKQALQRNASPTSDKLPRSEEQVILDVTGRYDPGYRTHTRLHRTRGDSSIVIEVRDQKYRWEAARPPHAR